MSCAVDVKNLSFKYPDGKEALNDITFSVHEGECVAIIGPNGSGKSTLLLHLNGILPVDHNGSQAVRIFDQPISTSVMDVIRRKVGLLFQDPDDQLFCPTVFEDVAFGPRQFGMSEEEVQKIVHEALVQVGLEGFDRRSPHHLSGGEKQRVCLAGILVCEPAMLALDEPTSDLDPRGKRELKIFLRSLPATKIIATHDLELVVELCPRTIVLDGGRIVADGSTIMLLNNEELMIAHGLERPHILQHQHPHH